MQVLVPEAEIPPWNGRKSAARPRAAPPTAPAPAPPARLYVISVFLTDGPVSGKFANKVVYRVIEIRGDQTLAQLHDAIFTAFDRRQEHAYEFQFGKRPFDPKGHTYGSAGATPGKKHSGDARTTTLDELHLKAESVFGYWFDFDAGWYHQVQVDRIEQAIPTVPYPRMIRRIGTAPPR